MDAKFSSALVLYASALYLVFGFVSVGAIATLTSSSYYTLGQLSTSLWTEVVLALIIGFLALVSGILVGSRSSKRVQLGCILAFMSSTGGVLNAMALMSTNFGYSGILVSFLPVGAVALFFVGYPLALAGSISSLVAISNSDNSTLAQS